MSRPSKKGLSATPDKDPPRPIGIEVPTFGYHSFDEVMRAQQERDQQIMQAQQQRDQRRAQILRPNYPDSHHVESTVIPYPDPVLIKPGANVRFEWPHIQVPIRPKLLCVSPARVKLRIVARLNSTDYELGFTDMFDAKGHDGLAGDASRLPTISPGQILSLYVWNVEKECTLHTDCVQFPEVGVDCLAKQAPKVFFMLEGLTVP